MIHNIKKEKCKKKIHFKTTKEIILACSFLFFFGKTKIESNLCIQNNLQYRIYNIKCTSLHLCYVLAKGSGSRESTKPGDEATGSLKKKVKYNITPQ